MRAYCAAVALMFQLGFLKGCGEATKTDAVAKDSSSEAPATASTAAAPAAVATLPKVAPNAATNPTKGAPIAGTTPTKGAPKSPPTTWKQIGNGVYEINTVRDGTLTKGMGLGPPGDPEFDWSVCFELVDGELTAFARRMSDPVDKLCKMPGRTDGANRIIENPFGGGEISYQPDGPITVTSHEGGDSVVHKLKQGVASKWNERNQAELLTFNAADLDKALEVLEGGHNALIGDELAEAKKKLIGHREVRLADPALVAAVKKAPICVSNLLELPAAPGLLELPAAPGLLEPSSLARHGPEAPQPSARTWTVGARGQRLVEDRK